MKMVYVLFAAVAAGAVIGGVRSLASSPPSAVPEPPVTSPAQPPAQPLAAAPPGMAADEPSVALEGEVLEVIDVPSYSYLRLGAKGQAGTWAAVPTATLKVGDHAHVVDAMKMADFSSPALKRTFPVIYFGMLEGARGAYGAPPAVQGSAHAGSMDVDPEEAMKAAHAPVPGEAPARDVKPVERAKGPRGKTVAEVIAERTQLSGKTVRIHATVVKSTPGILGHTYLHLRDGSGAGAADIAVTTDATPAVGDTVTVEGVVAIDRDIGAGYKFATIVEDAKILPSP